MVLGAQARDEAGGIGKFMNNSREAEYLFSDAQLLRQEAEESKRQEHYHRVVRKCQESVELALKALLLYTGIEYPKVHDVSKALLTGLAGTVSDETLKTAAEISRKLAAQKGAAFYGTRTVPAAEMFKEEDAESVMTDCDRILKIVSERLSQ